MGTASTTFGRLLCVLAAAAIAAGLTTTVSAQETVTVTAGPELRALLGRAEAALAGGDAATARELLAAREHDFAGNPLYDYVLGVAALDSGHTTDAILALQRAVAVAPGYSGARMELARAYFENGQAARARPLFAALLNENPPPGVREVIDRYLAAIDAGPATPPSRLQPYAELIAGYDDNANGSTDDQQFLGFTLSPENLATESAFFEAGAGLDWINPASATLAWQLGARVGYRSNPDASFVDSGVLSGLAGANWRRGAAFGHLRLDAYAATRDGESNEAYTGIDAALGRHINERWDLQLALRSGALRYDESIEVLDVNRTLYALGVSWRIAARGRLTLEAIGGQDSERQSGSPYGNSKSGVRLGFSAPLGRTAFLFGSLGSLTSDYDGQFFGSAREDDQLTSVLLLEFRDVWTEGLTVAPRLRYIDNDSDVALYDYDRTEFGLLFRWTP